MENWPVIIEYEEQRTILKVSIVPKRVTGISLSTMPTKTKYKKGIDEALDLKAGKMILTYNDGSTTRPTTIKNNPKIQTSGYNLNEVGTQEVTITYKENGVEVTTTYEIEVVD